jgi:hypothetical protein
MAFTQVNSLDFADIKTSLIEYMRANTDFTDYDFEASNLSAIIDLLAYNTYYTAFNTTMAVNETFLSTASLRDNVVRIAKQLGYVPKSRTSSKATVSLVVDFSAIAAVDPNLVPRFVTLKKGNCFIASNPRNRSETYQFGITEDIITAVYNNKAIVTNVEGLNHLDVIEGIYFTFRFTVDNTIPNQRFIIPTENIDSSTIQVFVRSNTTSSTLNRYVQGQNILNVKSDDRVFFVQETDDQRYELVFGDGVIGRRLENGEIIEVSYFVSSGENGNNIQNFVFSGEIYDSNNTRVVNNIRTTLISKSSGGSNVETVDQIKINAPKFYSSQNRAVTLDDYKIILQRIFPAIADIIVYGGEEESPPEYGRVKISIKPTYSDKLSNSTKRNILTELKKYAVASVIPVIIDPSIVEVIMHSQIYYDISATNLTQEQIKTTVIQNLTSYEETNSISKFNGAIRKSKLSTVIDSSEDSIVSNITRLTLRKKLTPAIGAQAQYLLCYVNPFARKCDDTTISSTVFRISDYPDLDVYFDNNEDGIIRIYTIDPSTSTKIIIRDGVGRVNFERGEVSIDLINIIRGSNDNNEIFISATPRNDDIVAVREVYLDLSLNNSVFTIIPE